MSGWEVEALRTKLAKKEEANQKLQANLVVLTPPSACRLLAAALCVPPVAVCALHPSASRHTAPPPAP